MGVPKTPWGVGDSWSSLSSEDGTSSWLSPEELSDPIGFAARKLEAEARKSGIEENSYDDLTEAIDTIQLFTGDPSDPPLYDTKESFESYVGSEDFAEETSREIGLLIRCNQMPDKILVEEGRALQPLSNEEKFDVAQLLIVKTENANQPLVHVQTTKFFNESISAIFQQHSMMEKTGNIRVLSRDGIAKWMTKCLKDESVGKHDKRVLEGKPRATSFVNL